MMGITEILEDAINRIRNEHGVAVSSVSVDWMATMSNRAAAITRVGFDGFAAGSAKSHNDGSGAAP